MKSIYLKKIRQTLVISLLVLSNLLVAQGGWEQVYFQTDFFFKDICFVSHNNWQTGWALEGSTVLKTTDGGDTWTPIVPGLATNMNGISFVDENNGYICAADGNILKSTDGGLNWTVVHTGAWYGKIAFKDVNNGVASGNPVVYTHDGGATWQNASGGQETVVDYGSGDTYYTAGLFSGVVSKSTDNGETWSDIYTAGGQLVNACEFYDNTYGTAGCSSHQIHSTTDGGSNWTVNSLGGSSDVFSAAYFDENTVYAGSGLGIYKSSNGGTSWVNDTTIPGIAHRCMTVTGNNVLYVTGDEAATFDGTIWRKIGPAPIIANFTVDNDSICVGSTVHFTDSTVYSPISWSWVFEGGTPATSTDQNPTVTYNTPGTYDVELTATNQDNSGSITKYDYIEVVDLPNQANTPVGDSLVCTNGFYNYTTAAVTYASSYEWVVSPSDAGTMSGNGTTATLHTANDWTGDFTIKVRATNICGNGDWSENLEGKILETPIAFEISEGGEYCDGETGIEITQDGSTEGIDYELFLDNVSTGTIIAGTGNEISYGFFTEEGEYTATGSNGACFEYMDGIATILLNYIPDPATMPIGDTSVCSGTTTNYTVMPIGEADTVYWSLSPSEAGAIMGSGEEISVEWSIDFEGSANLTAQGENACGLGDESEPLSINCSLSPAPEIIGSSMVCKEEEADYMTEYHDGSTYDWTVTGGTITMGEGTNQITVLWGNPGNGTVNLTETAGELCTGTAESLEVTIDDCIGLAENEASNLAIFPNPAENVINIQSESPIKSIQLMDLKGKNIIRENTNGSSVKLNVSNIESGSYIISVETEKETITRTVVIK